jgi:tRNA threonylcarbamoyladenosine biosynthesis protein TsaB
MAAQAMAETRLPRAAAIHDARRDEFYVEAGGDPVILPRDRAIEYLSIFAREPFALAGTGAPTMAEAIKNATLSSVRQPDALYVAKLALAMPETNDAPRPLYLRAPDARLPAQR